jgi:phage recombination protein Bet
MTQALTVKTDFTPEQMHLITSTIAKGATPDELKLFLYRCQHLGLDPLKPGQIYFIKYGSSPGTIVVGIEGFRARAASTGKIAGIKRGALKDDSGQLVGAFAEVYRSDWKECAREEVPLSEYNTGKGNWARMPETMIKKVAEAAALRMAFPDDLGGLYESAEMDQAAQSTVRPDQPTSEDGNLDSLIYKVPFGKWAQRTLEEIHRNHGEQAIIDYITYIEESAAKKNKEVTGDAAEFIKRAEQFLASFEQSVAEEMGARE